MPNGEVVQEDLPDDPSFFGYKFGTQRRGQVLVFHWRAARTGIAGFNLYTGQVQLNTGLIPVHRSSRYSVRVGPYTLQVVGTDGKVEVIAPR